MVTNCDHLGKLKFLPRAPYAFTEHGAIMAATLLKSPRAVEVSVFVVRAFVKLRQLALSHKELAAKLAELERKLAGPSANSWPPSASSWRRLRNRNAATASVAIRKRGRLHDKPR